MGSPLRSRLRRAILCRWGRHGPRIGPAGVPANFCGYCGFTFNPNAWTTFIVTLSNGEVHEVEAINEWHAGSQVVFGSGAAAIDGRTGKAIGEVRVHRENIVSIRPAKDDHGRIVSSRGVDV